MFETLAQIRLFSASVNTKNDSRFHSGNFSKGKAFYCAKASYELIYLFIYLFNRFHHDYNNKKDKGKKMHLNKTQKRGTKVRDTQQSEAPN